MEREEREKKVLAGRAKLASFRQRKTKGEGANPQKKTQKRKSAAVHANDVPGEEENSLARAEGGAEHEVYPKSSLLNVQSASGLEAALHVEESQQLQASERLRSTSPGNVERSHAQQQISVIQNNLKEQTVHMSELDKRAQELEKELETSHKTTKDKENQMAKLEDVMQEHEKKLEALQEKLAIAESSVSVLQQELTARDREIFQLRYAVSEHAPCHGGTGEGVAGQDSRHSLTSLITELKGKLEASETLREDLCRKLEVQMQEFQTERASWELKHENIIAGLTRKLQHTEAQAEEAKYDKERLNEELRGLKDQLRIEAESSQTLKMMHDQVLQTLKEERTKMFQDLSKAEWSPQGKAKLPPQEVGVQHDLRVDSFKHELEDLKKNLDRVKAKKGSDTGRNTGSEELDSMDRYLVPTQLLEQSDLQEGSSEHSLFELDSDFVLEQSLNSTTEGSINFLCSPMPITNVLAEGASIGTLLDPESFAVYLSNIKHAEEPTDVSVLSDERLAQKCALLMEQLHTKEQQLQKCSDDLEETLGKWRAVTAELEREKTVRDRDWKEQQRLIGELQNEGPGEDCDSETLKSILAAREEGLSRLLAEKKSLEERLSDVEQELEKECDQNISLKANIDQLNRKLQETEKEREAERQEFDNKLNSKGLEYQTLSEAIEEKEAEFSRRERSLCEEVSALKEVLAELETRLLEQVEQLNCEFQKRMDISREEWKEQTDLMKQEHERELSRLQASHQEDLHQIRTELENEKQQLLKELEQLNDSHQSQIEQAQASHQVEMEALRLSLTNMHAAHLELSQTTLHREKEDALIQLRDKLSDKRAQEVALLQGRHQFHMEQLQSQRCLEMERQSEESSREIERIQEQHEKEIERMREQHIREIETLREQHIEVRQEVERIRAQHVQEIEASKEQHVQEMEGVREQHVQAQQETERMREQHVQEIETLQEQSIEEQREVERMRKEHNLMQEEVDRMSNLHLQEIEALREEHIKEEMERIRDQHTLQAETLREQHMQDQESERTRENAKEPHLKEMEQQATAVGSDSDPMLQAIGKSLLEEQMDDQALVQQVSELQSVYHNASIQSKLEVQHLWARLDSRQDLQELKEQLLARSAQVDEMARMKKDFEQQRQQLKSDHEKELEELRIYFEEKSKATEDNYREELEMLHQRLREMKDEEVPFAQDCLSALVDATEHGSLLQQLTERLEQHKEELSYFRLQSEEKHKQDLDILQAALGLQYKEDLVNMKMDLSDRYISEIEALKTKHCLELEQLRARLSEEHIREITRLHLQNGQVEAEGCEKTTQISGQEYHQVVEQLDRDPHDDLDSTAKLNQSKKMCQTEPPGTTECTPWQQSHGTSSTQETDVSARDTHIQKLHDRYNRDLERATQRLRAEHDLARSEEGCREKVLQKDLKYQNEDELQNQCEEDLSARVSELQNQHEEELSARVSELQNQHEEELSARVSEPQNQHEEELSARVSELQNQHEGELSARVSELQNQHEEELSARVSELQKHHEEELSARVSELQNQREEELSVRVSELQNQHEEELSARVSELQKHHEEELSARVSELQNQHEEELSARVSELQKQHEEELSSRVSELQNKHKEEQSARVSELQKHHEEELSARVSELQKHHEEELSARVSELQKHHEEELSARVSELQDQREEELSARVSELQNQPEEELSARVSELQNQPEEELSARVSELQNQPEEELSARVSELQNQPEEELSARVSELQKHHEEELSARVSELQKHHEEELSARVSELQKHHEEELSARVSELQKHHEEELSARVSELQKHHEEELSARISELQNQHEEELSVRVSELQKHHEEELDFRVSELQKKHKEELSAHAAEIQQHHEAELSARISELQQQHQAQTEDLETTHMSKMDSLESSYLTEIHAIRNEHKLALVELEEFLTHRLLEKEREAQDRLAQAEVQFCAKKEQDVRLALELLRKELTAAHMDDVRMVAEELEAAHTEDLKVRLEEQRHKLEEMKNQALDALRGEVLLMEEQNQKALQELHNMHKVEVQQQNVQQEELRKQSEQLQKYELLVSDLNAQLQALSAELQEKTDQQRRYQEETELLKCQSETSLEQKISQLKEAFEAEKKVPLLEKEHLTEEVGKLQRAHRLETDHLQELLEEKSRQAMELQQRVSVLTKEMEATNAQLEMIVQRRERENQEGDNLVDMLRCDVQKSQEEQRRMQDSCQRLLKLFTDVLRSTLSTEDLIGKKIGLCLDSSSCPEVTREGVDSFAKPWGLSLIQRADNLSVTNDPRRASPDCDAMTEHSLMSSDEGCELSEYLCDTVLGSLDLGLDNEEKILRISQRLRTAVERLLEMVTDAASQLEQSREIQHRFEEQFNNRNQETAQVVLQNQNLLQQLAQETEAKNNLQVELHKARGLIDGFTAEKVSLEEALSIKESAEHHLAIELEKSRKELKVLSQETSVLGEGREVLLRLQEVLSGNVGHVEVELLKETERLAREKLELHCQAKKDRSNLLSQMKVLEMELEEQMSRNQELLKKTTEVSDLRQQIQSLEKQLKNQRHFMDEQAVEREHERDDFQQEIHKLEEQLKQALKNQGESRVYGLQEWGVQIETLEAQVKEKAADCNLWQQSREDLEQQIVERNSEIDKMLGRIQELEQAVLSNEEAAKKCVWLEAELQRMQGLEKELVQDREALQQQQYNNVLQISALQSKLDETRHRIPVEGEADSTFKELFEAEREALLQKEKEVESLAEQLELFRDDLVNKTEEILQLNMQQEIQSKQNEQTLQQVKEENLRLKHLWNQQKDVSSRQLSQALLQEKNQEIDHLNEQLVRLETEVAASQSTELEDLQSLVEHLRSDHERLQKDKEEEVERLHEVIEKLQNELEQLGPNRHEVSDSQESLDQLGLGEVENLQKELRKGARQASSVAEFDQDCTLGGDLPEDTLYHSEIEALQQQLEEQDARHKTEIEVLERNLHNLESSRQQVQELQNNGQQEERDLLTNRLSQREAEITSLSSQLQEREDSLHQKEAVLMEKELLLQTLQEQRVADLTDLEAQLAQRDASLEEAGTQLQDLRTQCAALSLQKALLDKEQNEKEERYSQEIQDVKRHLREWEEKAHTLTEELHRLAVESQLLSDPDTNPHLVVLKEQLRAVEVLGSEREAELHRMESVLHSVRHELEELRAQSAGSDTKEQVKVQTLHSAIMNQEANSLTHGLQKKQFDQHTLGQSFIESVTEMSAWDSPEMVRKQEEHVHSLRGLTTYSDLSLEYSADLDYIPSKAFGNRKQYAQYDLHDLAPSTPSLTGSNYSLSHDTHRSSPVGDTEHTCTDSASRASDMDLGQPELESPEVLWHEGQETANSSIENGHSRKLQNMLHMVHAESCKILALSEQTADHKTSSQDSQQQQDIWHQEKQNLQDAIQSLRSALMQLAQRKEKDAYDTGEDWRGELLHSVQGLLESERQYLHLELQSHLRHHGSGDQSSVLEKMEHVVKEQEEQKRLVLEHLLASDRNSLMSEIRDLRSQLRISHLQNQEKLQQLQESLTSAEEKGSTKEHQLRRKVELLEYKLQQEVSIADDLKASLTREKERVSEQHKLLLAEQGFVCQLRTELDETRLEHEMLIKSQKDLQMEMSRLRDQLKSKEEALALYVQTLKKQQEQENQRSEEQKILVEQIHELKEKTLQELSESLEEQRVQNNQLAVALQHEQNCSSNLRKELEIEQSRFEALLAQELRKLSDAGVELEKERQRSQTLSSTLAHKQSMLEKIQVQHTQELSRNEQERLQEHSMVMSLQNQLEEERSRSTELAAMLEKTQQQATSAKRQLEAELQSRLDHTKQEQESNTKLRAKLEAFQSQKLHMENTLERQRDRESCLQKERDQYQAQLLILQEHERSWTKEKERKREQQAEDKRAREEERERRILDLQLQHERDQHRIQELQNMLADLEEQERALSSRKAHLRSQPYSPERNEASALHKHDQDKLWQQVLHTVLEVKEWVQSRAGRTVPGTSGEEALKSLLDTLSELKIALVRGGLKPPSQSSSSVVDVLLSENRELTKSVTLLTKEKLELRNQLSKNNQKLRPSPREVNDEQVQRDQAYFSDAVNAALEAERIVWLREKQLLQKSLKQAESELSKVTSEIENRPVLDASSSKFQRLYRKYLRAESFRKALVYQKKYLLLLLGGFQACEKATLSLIARMGVYPSPTDLEVPTTSRPGLTKFRSTARAVIAISRLKFLVKKWQKNKKGGEPTAQSPVLLQQGPVNRTDVLRQQQLSSILLNSPPTREVSSCLRHSPTTIGILSPKTSYWTHNQLSPSSIRNQERSPCTTQDPELSLSKYIRHLEVVQERLGGLQKGSSPEMSQLKYARK
ncbi:pericentrin [Discoglossus pictus]